MFKNTNELEQAIQDTIDGTATEEQLLALRDTLKSDPAARERYYDHIGLHQSLGYRFSHRRDSETAHLLANARLRAQTRRSAKLALLAAAAVVVLMTILLRTILVPAPKPMAVLESAGGSLLTVEHADPNAELDAGELAADSLVTVSQGAVELKLRNGSRSVILAPATFSLRSERKLHLDHGTAWFHISEEDRGFEVTTPELHVTDLGTEFGVITGPGISDEVHVFKGRVIARSLNALGHQETLTSSHSRISTPVGRLDALASRPEAFLVRLPDATTDRLIVNGDFESGTPPPDLKYGLSATPALLPGWRFGREITVMTAASEGRWDPGGAINNQYPLHFGRSPVGAGFKLFLNGSLDDVAIWDAALSRREIDALWNRGAGQAASAIPSSAGLVANWAFDSDLSDTVGSRDARAFGDAGIQAGTGKIGPGAAVFDGKGDYLTAGSRDDFAIGTEAISVSFWFKVADVDKGTSHRFLATGASLNNQDGWTVFMDDSAPPGDRIGAAMSDGTGRTVQKGHANGRIDPFDGKWHLAVVVFDAPAATVTTYLDSIPETTIPAQVLNGGAVGVNVITILSSTADRQLGFHADTPDRPHPDDASVYQTFRTEPGREYQVEFEMGGIFFRHAEVEITASIHDGVGPLGDPIAQHVERRSRQSGTGYNPPASFLFTAASTTTSLVFTETSGNSEEADPVLDNVHVRPLGNE